MSSALKAHLPVIVLVSVICIISSAFFMTAVHDNAGVFGASTFTFLLIAIPCVFMVLGSFFVMLTTKEIGTRIFLIVEVICVVFGFVSMAVASGWESDASVVALIADGSSIVPVANSPFGIVRNILLYVCCPMVGSVLGAYLGSRLHPVSIDRNNKSSKKQPRNKKSHS